MNVTQRCFWRFLFETANEEAGQPFDHLVRGITDVLRTLPIEDQIEILDTPAPTVTGLVPTVGNILTRRFHLSTRESLSALGRVGDCHRAHPGVINFFNRMATHGKQASDVIQRYSNVAALVLALIRFRIEADRDELAEPAFIDVASVVIAGRPQWTVGAMLVDFPSFVASCENAHAAAQALQETGVSVASSSSFHT